MKNFFIITLISLFFLGSAAAVDAATLYISPASASASAGNNVNVTIMTDTQGLPINTVDSTILFPTDLLQVESLSKGGSIFSIWAEEPTYSNITGRIDWSGGLPSPGYTGNQGAVLSVTFKTRKPGTATVGFGDSVVLKNDGMGTNILSMTQGASIGIGEAAPVVKAPVAIPVIKKSPIPAPTKVEVPAAASFPNNIALLVLIMLIGWYKYFALKLRMREEIDVAITDSHEKLMSIKKDLNADLEKLEEIKKSRKLDDAEQKFFKQLEAKVDKVDKTIARKLNKIK